MNKNRIIAAAAALCVLCTACTSFSALAADDAPSKEDLKAEMVKAVHTDANWKKVKELAFADYRGVIKTTDEITINVNENNVRKLNKEITGVQYEMVDNYSMVMDNGEFTDEFIETATNTPGIPVLRMGGTTSNYVDYIRNIGPVASRTATPDIQIPLLNATLTGSQAMQMGPAEIIRAYQYSNKDLQVMPCIYMHMTPEDANHLAHYLLDDKDESEWGALRAGDGIEEPVGVFYWELGNEIDGQNNVITDNRVKSYTDWCISIIEAIKADFPEQKFIFCGRSASWENMGRDEDDPLNTLQWSKKVFPILAKYVDGSSFHPYYDGYSSEYMMYMADEFKRVMDEIVEEQQITDENGELKDMVIVSTESSRYTPITVDNCDFDSAVCTSHYFNNCLQREWYAGSMFHNGLGSQYWCLHWLARNGEVMQSPTAKMMVMYRQELGDRLVEAEIENAEQYTYWAKDDETCAGEKYLRKNFSVIASPNGEHELKIFLTNRVDYGQRNIRFNFNNKYKLVEETVFTAPNASTWGYDKESEALTTIEKHEMNVDNFTEYEMKGEGIVVLTLKTDSKLPYRDGEDSSDGDVDLAAPEVTETAFADIDNSYARNEIAALAEEGIIKGKSETLFAPEEYVTRAETAVLLQRALELDDYRGNFWSDVSENAWYKGAANAMYIEQLMSGESFNPDAELTMLELMRIIGDYLIKRDNADVGELTNNGFSLTPQGAYCVNKGLFLKMLQNGTVAADKLVTREEIADVIYKFRRLVQ